VTHAPDVARSAVAEGVRDHRPQSVLFFFGSTPPFLAEHLRSIQEWGSRPGFDSPTIHPTNAYLWCGVLSPAEKLLLTKVHSTVGVPLPEHPGATHVPSTTPMKEKAR
jgi:hypothetical protein